MLSVERQPTFRRNMTLPSLGSKKSQVRNQHEADSKQSFAMLKVEATWSSVTPVDFQRSRRRYVPEDRTLQLCPLYLRIVWAAYAAVPPLLSITRLQDSVRQQLATYISVNWYDVEWVMLKAQWFVVISCCLRVFCDSLQYLDMYHGVVIRW
jgi:hypothetical protein